MRQNTGRGKRIAIFLILLAVCWTSCTVNSEEADRSVWECHTCGGLSDGNYCPWCGAGKPMALIQCPHCHIMYHQEDQYVFCKSCGALLHPVDTTGLSAEEAICKRLDLFMIYWRPNRTSDLVELCAPSWREQQENAKSAIFFLLGNRNAVSYELESAQLSADGAACEIRMNCRMSKNNGKAPVPFRVSLKMVCEEGNWFIDPATMKMEELPEEPAAESPGTMPPTPTPTPYPSPTPLFSYDFPCYMCGALSPGESNCMFCGAPRGMTPTPDPEPTPTPTPVATVPPD